MVEKNNLKEFQNGFKLDSLALPDSIRVAVEKKDWGQVDRLCAPLIDKGGLLFELLQPLSGHSYMEFIINVRDAVNPWEEDGIWHDDGSRVLAFTLGLNLNPEAIEGGNLLIRKKNSPDVSVISPPAFGELVIFKTGVSGFEHKVEAVKKGHRVVMAGWCYQ